MTIVKQTVHYSCNVHSQPNANYAYAKQRVGWSKRISATSRTGEDMPSGAATSNYAKTKKKPWTLTATAFNLDIPKCAYINDVTFTVRMKCTGSLNVHVPYARFNIYGGTKSVETYRVGNDGWDDGFWYTNSSNYIKLTNNYRDVKYSISGAEIRKRGYPVNSFFEYIMGIDLNFYNPTKWVDSTISVAWVSCTITYELPDEKIIFDRVTSENNPYWIDSGKTYRISANYRNDSNAGCSGCRSATTDIALTLPPNVEVTPLTETGNVQINGTSGTWTVPCTPNASRTLILEITDYGIGEKAFTFSSPTIPPQKYWVYSTPLAHDVGKVTPYPRTMQKGVVSCIRFESKVNATDGTANYIVNLDTVNNSARDVIWTVDDANIEIDSSDDTHLNLIVPRGEVREITFNACFIPRFTGDTNVSVQLDTNTPVVKPYTCLNAPEFVVTNNPQNNDDDRTVSEIQFNPCEYTFETHRVASSTEIGAFVIDCGVADYDSEMVVEDCTLTASTWEKLDYIGMIPLRYHHYDPKSTYENKAISQSYKNKTYKGKEGVIDEDISLQFKVRPPQATTLQGLVKLDKPTPINANHRCFEGDVLNHRGWVVLSKVEVERTNPLWYDVKATVDYITHDINTKFQIFKGNAVNSVAMPDLQADVFELGQNLATGLDVFKIDTDGGFIYDEDSESVKNIFSLDDGQHLSINTINTLSDVAKIRFDWYSNRISEFRENRISRIFRLRDKDGNSIFEYEYTDFEFVDDFVTCTVNIRYQTKEGGWEAYTESYVDLKTDIEVDPIIDDNVIDVEPIYDDEGEEPPVIDPQQDPDPDDDEDTGDEEPPYDPADIAPSFDPAQYVTTLLYGTSLSFELNHNQLIITDEGYNGREVSKTITLIDSDYTFETYWQNNNQDGTTEDILTYIDIELSETLLRTQYEKLYKDMVVSPFPVPYKKVMFTRESEEGTIYYMNDAEPFKYRLEPFYQYHCGTDLVTRDGISIFDLNNSYTYFYIENGLVRLGFNKFNGRLYLAKWDISSKEWVTTHYFKMSNDTIFSVAKYSDDKIVIKAGTDTYFTIWRGHPYILIQNPNNEIEITSKFNYCLSDKVEGTAYDYPIIHSFLNTDNMLPPCIGGKSIDYRCIEVDDDQISPALNHDITVNPPSELIAGEESIFTVTITPSTSDGEVHYIVNGEDIAVVESPFSWTSDGTHFKEAGTYTIQAIYTGDDDDMIAISPEVTVIVKAPNPRPDSDAATKPPAQHVPNGQYALNIISAPKSFTYRDGKTVTLQLTRGGKPVDGALVELVIPDGRTDSNYTSNGGKISITNDSMNYLPANHQWGGRFYDNWDDDSDRKLLYSALKWIEIKKATPTFTHNAKNNKVSKGKSVTIKLNGVDSKKDPTKKGLANTNVTYSYMGLGWKKKATTDANGKFSIKMPLKGNFKVYCEFAGSKRYNAVKKTFNFKVI